MIIIEDILRSKIALKNPVLAVGVFDGVHVGHQHLIRKMLKKARALRGTGVVMTFYPHPAHVLQPQKILPLLTSLSHRLKLMKSLGVAVCVVVKFTKQFSRLTPQQFIDQYVMKKIHPLEIFVGEDFHFGRNRAGDLLLLKEVGRKKEFRLNIVSHLEHGSQIVSSSRLRKLIMSGYLRQASQLLGRPFSILGRVVKGEGRGKKLGYPTANINVHDGIMPPCGVYAVQVILRHRRFQGMANIGRRPSFANNNPVNCEVHVLDFRGNLYGQEIEAQFLKKLRDEQTFPSSQDLMRQLQKDEKRTRRFFSRR